MASAGAVLLEARPFRPFKSSEEYLYAMKEDLAEWLTVLYPELRINADNFLDRLDTGVALCRSNKIEVPCTTLKYSVNNGCNNITYYVKNTWKPY
ncbi:unnamed protein product [Euphydryas editha]|uniref:GAS2-like protein 2 n=1 Tax=Euphydryas editha TaxID=104508 RepID=A0AAU9U6N8_EUPED|nr:unnamed protein product [Euphydryas editha]